MSLSASVCVLLSQWVSFLLVAVAPRSRRTVVELLIGCMLNPEGWVTRAIGAIGREAHWSTYYKLIERMCRWPSWPSSCSIWCKGRSRPSWSI
jgi:hypothetical protein